RGGERAVAPPSRAAPRDHDARPRGDEVGDEPVVLEDLGACGQVQLDVGSVGAVLAGAAPGLAAGGAEDALRPEAGEVAEVAVGDEDDVAAAAAVAAVGTALRHELLAAEAQSAVAAAARLHLDSRAVVEHLGCRLEQRERGAVGAAGDR